MSELPFKLQKSLTGKIQVKYGCPSCGLELESALLEAGRKDTCPGCKTSFVVPGVAKKREHEEQRVAAEEEKRQEVLRKKLAEEQKQLVEEQTRETQIKQQQLLSEQKRLADEKAQQEFRKLHSGYVYHVENFCPTALGCDKLLTDFLNHFAAQGWEYVGFEIVRIYDPPGCLPGLFGQPGGTVVYHLVTFKKPLPK